MIKRNWDNSMYTTIPPIEDIPFRLEDLYEEEDYNEQYEITFGDIIEENREFIDYEQNYFKNILQHDPLKKRKENKPWYK